MPLVTRDRHIATGDVMTALAHAHQALTGRQVRLAEFEVRQQFPVQWTHLVPR